jgi:hypothetical protein
MTAAAHAQTASTSPSAADASVVPVDVLRGLASDDFIQREAAQKRLEEVPIEQRAALGRLFDAISDQEVKARLMRRMDEIDEELAINPPPISISVKDATLQQVAAGLSKSMGISMQARIGTTEGTDRFTLTATNQPFWEIFYQLHAQHPITFSRGTMGDWFLNDDGSKADKPLEIVKGFVVEVSTATPRVLPTPAPNLGLLAAAGGRGFVIVANDPLPPAYPGGLAVTYRLTADPRVNVLTLSTHAQGDMRDDKGNSLGVVSTNQASTVAKAFSWGYTALIGTPAETGATIKSMKVAAVMTAPVDTRHMIIEHPEEQLNKPIRVGGATFIIERFSWDAPRVSYALNVSDGAPATTSYCVIDADGQRLSFSDSPGRKDISLYIATKPPFKLELTAPREVKEITLPLEWREIPIDGKPAVNPQPNVINRQVPLQFQQVQMQPAGPVGW